MSAKSLADKVIDRTHIEFARRFERACDDNPNVPGLHQGRLGWFVKEFEQKFGERTTVETVRRWLAGIARPKPSKLAMLAQILGVDEAWLSVGTEGELRSRRKITQSAKASGAANILAGLIQLSGGTPAFPSETDPRVSTEGVDLYAIIKGAQYAMHVEVAAKEGDKTIFLVPSKAESVVNVGIEVSETLDVRIYELPWDVVQTEGTLKSGHYQITTEDEIRRITDLTKRF